MPESKWPDLKQLNAAILQKGKIIVKRKPPDEVSEGGVVLPDASQQSLPVGRVVYVGERADDARIIRGESGKIATNCIAVGNVVIFNEYDAVSLPEAFGDDLLLLNAADVIFRFKGQ